MTNRKVVKTIIIWFIKSVMSWVVLTAHYKKLWSVGEWGEMLSNIKSRRPGSGNGK